VKLKRKKNFKNPTSVWPHKCQAAHIFYFALFELCGGTFWRVGNNARESGCIRVCVAEKNLPVERNRNPQDGGREIRLRLN
jgi:hypothetical protein